MDRKTDIPAERLRQVLNYNKKTGHFTWRISLSNRVRAGARAGAVSRYATGAYRKIRIDTVLYFEHHLAWLWVTGQWPPDEIDHRNTDGTDNSWHNLRLADHCQNAWNKGLQKSNTSGAKGVHLRSDTKRWSASITFRNQTWRLGCFATKAEARKAYAEAAKKVHGEFHRIP